ncbi:MAG TPA: DUF1015 domain-containing protein [Bryobacteraceae bacterium]|nr:DUF1015 domain-containing protein [Bryobacteraceae bacterium]
MATVKPFQPFRYQAKAGDPANLLTQPYDKISPQMHARYLAASPYNLVRIILGEKREFDNESENVYTRAAKYLDDWIKDGILAQDPLPGFYGYSQEFLVPDSGEKLTRNGFIGLGKLEDYSANIVYRHEQTLTGPKKDRRELLNNTRAHFGQIFMLYPDPARVVDAILTDAETGAPILDVLDEYQARHRVWAITDAAMVQEIESLMSDKKLLIADGHHRYETALAYSKDHAGDPAAQYVMMTFVNMHAPGLKILATHRVLRGIDPSGFHERAKAHWKATPLHSVGELKRALAKPDKALVRIGIVTVAGQHLLERPRADGELDVPVLHKDILGGLLGISEEDVKAEKHIQYVRGVDAAVAEVRQGDAEVAFILEATPIEDMARIAFAGGVMPQKSTDFYPKLLSGVTIYKLG